MNLGNIVNIKIIMKRNLNYKKMFMVSFLDLLGRIK